MNTATATDYDLEPIAPVSLADMCAEIAEVANPQIKGWLAYRDSIVANLRSAIAASGNKSMTCGAYRASLVVEDVAFCSCHDVIVAKCNAAQAMMPVVVWFHPSERVYISRVSGR